MVLPLCREAVGIFYCPSQQCNTFMGITHINVFILVTWNFLSQNISFNERKKNYKLINPKPFWLFYFLTTRHESEIDQYTIDEIKLHFQKFTFSHECKIEINFFLKQKGYMRVFLYLNFANESELQLWLLMLNKHYDYYLRCLWRNEHEVPISNPGWRRLHFI